MTQIPIQLLTFLAKIFTMTMLSQNCKSFLTLTNFLDRKIYFRFDENYDENELYEDLGYYDDFYGEFLVEKSDLNDTLVCLCIVLRS